MKSMKSPVFMDSMHEEDLALLESYRGRDTSLSRVVRGVIRPLLGSQQAGPAVF